MSTAELLLLALALSADAFTVGAGIALTHRERRQIFRLSFHFGFFQGLLAGLGMLLGAQLLRIVAMLDHWIAFALLAWIGIGMLRSGDDRRRRAERLDLTRGRSLVGLSIAVSIDAFAAGVGLAAVDVDPWAAISLIAAISGLATLTSFRLTGSIAAWLGRRGERVAGVVLILLGINILVEHLFGA